MIESPTISVIIPVYNVELYLRKCLDSLLNQTFKNFEAICINDGSTDSSLDILKEYKEKDDRFIVIDQENGGVSNARNNGIAISKGEYVYFLDGDDYLDDDFLERFYENAKENESEIVVLSSFWNLDKRVNKKYHSALPTWSIFIKKDILKEYPYVRYPLNVHPGEDGIFSHLLLIYSKNISFEYNTQYHYIKRDDQSTAKALKEPGILLNDMKKWFDILKGFYDKYSLWEDNSLSFAKYVEGEAFLAFRTKNFKEEEERKVFYVLKKILDNILIYVNKNDYQYFSKEFRIFIESNTIKEYYSKVKSKYNYIRLKLFRKNISIRYRENRYKYYKNDRS